MIKKFKQHSYFVNVVAYKSATSGEIVKFIGMLRGNKSQVATLLQRVIIINCDKLI